MGIRNSISVLKWLLRLWHGLSVHAPMYLHTNIQTSIHVFFCFFFLSRHFFRVTPMAYGGSQARG